MKFSTKLWSRIVPVSLWCCMLAIPVQAQQKTDNNVLSVEKNSRDNTVKAIRFSENSDLRADQAQAIFAKYLPLNEATDKMVLRNKTLTKAGVLTERYDQYYKGIKIERGNYVIVSKNGTVSYMMGNFYKTDASLSTQAALTAGTAFNYALENIDAKKYMWQDAGMEQLIKTRYNKADTSYLPTGKLAWIEDCSTGVPDGRLHLAYSFDIYAMEPLGRYVTYVDAMTGKILYKNPLIKHTAATGVSLYSGTVPMSTAFTGGNYKLYDSTRGNGIHTLNLNNGTNYAGATEFTNATTIWLTAKAERDAHWATQNIYDYWKNVQGRLSYDNADAILMSYVHYSTNYDNAFWDGSEMTYGDGSGLPWGFSPLTSLDVAAHEIGHGVCEYTAGLDYMVESGAMNEGFSDCWGAVIENYANPHEVDAVAKSTWDMGEEIGSTPLRSMSDPTLHGDPGTYGGPNWFDVVGCTPSGGNDQCGVHTNSGVLNHWFYFVCVGDTGTNDIGNPYSVPAIGILEGADILYQTELSLTNSSTYADCRTASIAAAAALYGACSQEVQTVTHAWYAVNVGPEYVPCQPQLGFTQDTVNITEWANTTSCQGYTTVYMPIAVVGLPPQGGSPVVKAVQTGGNAVLGVDYVMLNDSATFAMAVAPDTQFIGVKIFDNGAINDDRDILFTLSLNANGSNSTLDPTLNDMHIFVKNNDNPPTSGSSGTYTITGPNTVTGNMTSPFFSSNEMARTQYIITAAEMSAAGILPGVPITSVGFTVSTKNSTQPFNGYTISMGNTSVTDMTTSFVTTGLTQVYSNNYSTVAGVNTIPFTTPFVWDGVKNVVMNICFTNPTAGPSNDRVDAFTVVDDVTTHSNSNAAPSGCGLAYNGANTSNAKPVMIFSQTIPPTLIETSASSQRPWPVKPGQEVYFYSTADSQLIAGMKNQVDSLGCVDASVTQAGNGFTPFGTFAPVNRSLKEFEITATANTNSTYTAMLYLTDAELNAATTANLRILKTNAATDAGINMGNTQIVTPTVTPFTSFTEFSGNFTGFSRFFFIDGPVTLPVSVGNANNTAGDIHVDNNPFHDNINMSYHLTTDTKIGIKLMDITGKVLYSNERTISRDQNHFTIDCGNMYLATGNYILQVVTPSGVLNQKMVKQ